MVNHPAFFPSTGSHLDLSWANRQIFHYCCPALFLWEWRSEDIEEVWCIEFRE